MRVMRGKSYEGANGVWEKIEIELETQDLLPVEQREDLKHIQPMLLELRAEQHIIAFLARTGKMSREQAQEKSAELKEMREGLLAR